MCTEEFIRMMFMVDLYGNCGLDSCTYTLCYGLILKPDSSSLI